MDLRLFGGLHNKFICSLHLVVLLSLIVKRLSMLITLHLAPNYSLYGAMHSLSFFFSFPKLNVYVCHIFGGLCED